MKNSHYNPETNKRFFVWTITLIIAISLPAILQTKTANASLFSFLASLWNQPVSAKLDRFASSSNSQNIALLQAANNIDPNPDKAGEISPIGSGETLVADIAMTNDTSSDTPINTQISTYVVQSGDTVSSVAKMFGVSVSTVLWANNINSKSALHVGDTLVILPISGINYTVKKGDTIQAIVKKYKADIGDVLAYNDISLTSTLAVGDTIIIPNAEIIISVPIKIIVGNNPAHDTNGPMYPGYYIRPIDGGRRTQGLHGYNAIDLADRTGTPIYASAAGTVIVARTGGWNGGYGSFVIISHNNGTQTLYGHASKVLVSAGQYVAQGQTIALLGSTGESTGPHVHFEIRGARNPF
ncbi:MAG: M23 family metallopeptidase [Candidatus Taylorbacteria bacterium]